MTSYNRFTSYDVCLYYKALEYDFLSRNSDFRLSGIVISYRRTGDGKCPGILNLEQTEHQIEVEERRLNLAKQQMKVAKRKARNHSLIVRGAEVEKAFPEVKVLTEEEFRAFLKCIAHMKSVHEMLEWSVSHSEYNRSLASSGKEQ